MNELLKPIVVAGLACGLLLSVATPAVCDRAAHAAIGGRGMVATVHPLATQAGLVAFRQGGNAVDAAIAAAITLGVVDGHNSGIGGGCFILVRRNSGEIVAIDGRETAPRLATRDMYVRGGLVDPQLSQTGALAPGVPGALAAYDLALQQAGQLRLADLFLPAAELAEAGFPIDRVTARNLRETVDDLRRFEATRQVLLKPNGQPFRTGEHLVQADLAKSYRAIAKHGADWFYQGPFAKQTEQWMQDHGGLLSRQDFSDYRPVVREPITSTYRGYTLHGFPPPSSGGIHVAEILNILEHFDLQSIFHQDEALLIHVITEAMKLAFADRSHWLGDADFVEVPRGLISKEYGHQLAAKIDLNHTTPVTSAGSPPDWETDFFRRHTTHIAAADAQGTWVAITATVNTSFGSKVMIPHTGIILNNEMDDFSARPGQPNAFGLVGGVSNAIEAGKRPLSSMSPTIIEKDGEPVLTVGAAGGPKIITQVLCTIVRFIDLQMPLEECVAQPRWHHQWLPNVLFVEPNVDDPLLTALGARGHQIETLESAAVVQAICRQPDGRFVGVHDPRVPGQAAGLD